MKRIMTVISALFLLILLGTVGYMAVEGWSLSDSLFMTSITCSTVGYSEVRELSPNGRVFTNLLICISLVVMTIWSATLTSYFVEMDLNDSFKRRRKLRMISTLKDHVIVCGTTPVVDVMVARLRRQSVPLVVVSHDAARLDELKLKFRNLLTLEGKPDNDLILAQANVLNAKIVVAAMENDIENLLIGITCGDLGEEINVFAFSNDHRLGNRMLRVGVFEVISPAELLGDHVATLVEKCASLPH